ncbi:MAG: M15 family metallopeptidase [Lachnospiraceae bacterium]
MRKKLLFYSFLFFCALVLSLFFVRTTKEDHPPVIITALPEKKEPLFTSSRITDEIASRMKGNSYPKDCELPLSDLRYLKIHHYGFDQKVHKGELVVHKHLAHDILKIMKALYEARYPIEKMHLIDDYQGDDLASMEDNNTSCFNYRRVANSSTLSNHAKGLAIDINPLYNPYVRIRNGKTHVEPASALLYVDRNASFSYKITEDDLCCKLFKQYGFTWGGDWTSCKDYQHFERP